MSKLQALLVDIEKLRKNLHVIINQKGINLTDPDVISASEILNEAITKYNEILMMESRKILRVIKILQTYMFEGFWL